MTPTTPPTTKPTTPVCDKGKGGKDKCVGQGPRKHGKDRNNNNNNNNANNNGGNGNGGGSNSNEASPVVTTNTTVPSGGSGPSGSGAGSSGGGLVGTGCAGGGYGGYGGGFGGCDGTGYSGPVDGGYGGQAAQPIYPVQTPVTAPQVSPVAPDVPQQQQLPPVVIDQNDENTAWITLVMPAGHEDDAEVSLNGVVQTSLKGSPRRYVTAKLDPTAIYHYEVAVAWKDDKGVPIKYTTKLRFTAGDEIHHTVPKDGKPVKEIKEEGPAKPPAEPKK